VNPPVDLKKPMRIVSRPATFFSPVQLSLPGIVSCLAGALLVTTGWSATYDVGVFDFFFEPFELSVQTGDTVAWTAYGYGHTVIADNGVFDSFAIWPGAIPALSTFRHTFHEAGTYLYYSLGYGGPDGAGMSAAIFVTGPVTNQLPASPTNHYPANAATNQPVRAELRAGEYVDADPGDYHKASQWLIRRATDNQVVYDSGEVFDNALTSTSKTNRFLPPDLLAHGTAYLWQVRYRDNFGGWSAYSTPTSFSTVSPLLRAIRRSAEVMLVWTTNSADFALEYSSALASPEWMPVHSATEIVNGQNIVVHPATEEARFYRLKKL